MSSIESVLEKILVEDNGKSFYSFANSSGKRWIMPVQNMKVAMNLYQPGWRTGKILKALFPYLFWLKPVQNKIGAEKLYCRLNDRLSNIIKEVFSIKDFEFSIFCGTPCVHQKIVMQISSRNRILGYCKICDNKEVIASFDYEYELLGKLASMGIDSVPKPLFNDYIYDGVKMFVQSTSKTMKSQTNHIWSKLEEDFLEDVYLKSHKTVKFEDSDFFRDILFLKNNINLLDGFNKKVVVDAIDKVFSHYGNKSVDFSFYHADFTPWNCYIEKNRLYAFDMEYAKMTYPPYIDCFHFFVQGLYFEKHYSVDNIISEFENNKKTFEVWFDNSYLGFACYLLAVIFLFTKRENGCISDEIKPVFEMRISLLEKILYKI